MYIFLTFLSAISVCTAAVYFNGKCPDVKPVTNFNITAYAKGHWYQVARYPNAVEGTGDCVTFAYRQAGDVYEVTASELRDHEEQLLRGQIQFAPGANGRGMLVWVSPDLTESEKEEVLPLKVLAIRYDGFAIIYECKYDKTLDRRHDFVWYISRTPKLSEEDRAAVEQFASSSGFIDPSLFIWDHFDSDTCRGKAATFK